MNLSKLVLNPLSRAVQNDIDSPYELHRTLVSRGFPHGQPENNRLLFRVEPPHHGGIAGHTVLVQSSLAPPDWAHLPGDYCKRIEGPQELEISVGSGRQLAFRLVANPVIKRKRRDELSRGGKQKHYRHALIEEVEHRQWLIRRSLSLGFRLLYLNSVPFKVGGDLSKSPTHRDKNSIPHFGVRFDGLLEVIDPVVFGQSLQQGIGPARAFGFGLLSVASPL